MNRRERRQAEKEERRANRLGIRKAREAGATFQPAKMETMMQLLALKGCEPLDAPIIEDLKAAGWPEERLAWAFDHSGFYCADRNSIVFPTKELENDRPAEELLRATVHEMTLDGADVLDHYHKLHLT